MERQEFRTRWLAILRKLERSLLVVREVSRQSYLRNVSFEMFAEHEEELIVESNKSSIESSVVQARKADAVPHIKPLFFVGMPRKNMAGYEEWPDRNSSHSTPAIEVIENHLTEVLLSAAELGGRG